MNRLFDEPRLLLMEGEAPSEPSPAPPPAVTEHRPPFRTRSGEGRIVQPPSTRRAFLRAVGATVVAVLAGEWWTARRAPARIAPAPMRIDATTLSPGHALSFRVPDTDIDGLLVRLAGGDLAAFDRRCPHLGCPVLWSAARERFECPCHAAAFAADGAVISGPPRQGLGRLDAAVHGDAVWISGEASRARDPSTALRTGLPLTPSLVRRGNRKEGDRECEA